MKPHEIRQALEHLPTVQEKIDYLEALPDRQGDHFVLYTLASLYLEKGDPTKAESLLREDLRASKDYYDRYESESLLTGLYMDQKREIPLRELEEMVRHFQEMVEEAKSEIDRLRAVGKSGGGILSTPQSTRDGRELLERRKKFQVYMKDPYQLERMIGDYYHGRDDNDKAFAFYEHYYSDLDKPIETFVPESMRRYADLLLKKGRTEEALFFIGHIITLKPYMLEDLFSFADLYYGLNDRISALLILMFTYTLCEGYDSEYAENSKNSILKLSVKIRSFLPYGQLASELAQTYLSGEKIPEMLRLIEGLKKEGIRNFFFSYLEGIAHFVQDEYTAALARFTEFNDAYPYLAESHYYQLVCMYKTDQELYSGAIASAAEKAIDLKPGSSLAEMAKIYLGTTLGLGRDISSKLLIQSEIRAILNSFLFQEAPVKVLDRLVASLTIKENPYQAAQVQLMAKVTRRREVYVSYLRNVCDLLNETGKRNIRQVLAAMGEALP